MSRIVDIIYISVPQPPFCRPHAASSVNCAAGKILKNNDFFYYWIHLLNFLLLIKPHFQFRFFSLIRVFQKFGREIVNFLLKYTIYFC